MSKTPVLLAAVTPPGFRILERALGAQARLIPAYTMHQALAEIGRSELRLLVCSMHFDDSRMFDLLREAKAAAPEVPIVACRLIGSVLTDTLVEAMGLAVRQLGAETFVDYQRLEQQHGEGAGAELAATLLRHCETRSEQEPMPTG